MFRYLVISILFLGDLTGSPLGRDIVLNRLTGVMGRTWSRFAGGVLKGSLT